MKRTTRRRLRLEKLECRQMLAGMDVNSDGDVTTQDALLVINHLAVQHESESLPVSQYDYDVNGDGKTSTVDALTIVNHLAIQTRAPEQPEMNTALLVMAMAINVPNPGNGADITDSLRSAINSAPDGATLVLPAGNFRLVGTRAITINVDKSIHLKGQGKGVTTLYRDRADATDQQLDWGYMIGFRGTKNPDHVVEIEGITFQGLERSTQTGDGKSISQDQGVYFNNVAVHFHHCEVKWIGYTAVKYWHDVGWARGVIHNNDIHTNFRWTASLGIFQHGYGVGVHGVGGWVDDPQFGSENFVFIEDNYFNDNRHSVAASHPAKYVFRYNTIEDNDKNAPIDFHGAGSRNDSTRAVEIYENEIRNNTGARTWAAISARGGEGVIWNNRITGHPQGFNRGIQIWPEVRGSYPQKQQHGWQSGLQYGAGHRGTDPDREGKGDLWVWGNDFDSAVLYPIHLDGGSQLVEGRDVHFEPRPGYVPYAYPHPMRSDDPPPPPPPPVEDPTLAGHWPLSGDLTDHSGYGNDAIDVGSWLHVGPDEALDLSAGAFTQAVWITPEQSSNQWQGIVTYKPGSSNAQRYPGLWSQDGDRIHFGFGDGSRWNGFTTGRVLDVGELNHVAATFDGSQYVVYVNGDVVRTQALNRSPHPTQQFNIGQVFAGEVDDVRIYTRALSASDVDALFAAGPENPDPPPPPPPPPVIEVGDTEPIEQHLHTLIDPEIEAAVSQFVVLISPGGELYNTPDNIQWTTKEELRPLVVDAMPSVDAWMIDGILSQVEIQ